MPSQQIPTLNPYNSGGIVDPLANAQHGALAFAYGVPQMEMDQRDQELAFQQANLKYGEQQKDVPLQDLKRQVEMGQQDIQKRLQDQGISQEQAMQEALAKTETSKAQQEHAKLTQDISKGQSTLAAAEEIDGLEKKFGPPSQGNLQWASAWDDMRARYAARGVPLPPQPDVNGVDMFRNKANAIKQILPQWQDREAKLAVVNAQGATAEKVARITAQGHLDSANAMANYQRSVKEDLLPPDKKIAIELERELAKGTVVTADMVDRYYATTDKKPEENKAVDTDRAEQITALKAAGKDKGERKDVVVGMGLPASYAEKDNDEILRAREKLVRNRIKQDWAQNVFSTAIAKGQYDASAAKTLGVPPPKRTQQSAPISKPQGQTTTPSSFSGDSTYPPSKDPQQGDKVSQIADTMVSRIVTGSPPTQGEVQSAMQGLSSEEQQWVANRLKAAMKQAPTKTPTREVKGQISQVPAA